MTKDCAFCHPPDEDVVLRDGPCFAIRTGERPVGSVMVLPRAHREAPWDLTEAEWAATRRLLMELKKRIESEHAADGWNVGWNVMPVGGQSIPHAHCHLIPRYADEPYTGRGIRWWFKSEANKRPTESSATPTR